MALAYLYYDAYLAPLITQEREDRAIAEVAGYGTFPAEWTERLVRLRAYCIACSESQKAPDDLFATKLKTYSKDFAETLPLARAAQDALTSESGLGTFGSVSLERA